MAEHIDPWDALKREELEKSRAAFEAHPDFRELVAEAAVRGFRRITLAEQMDVNPDAFTWRGGVWMKSQSIPTDIPA